MNLFNRHFTINKQHERQVMHRLLLSVCATPARDYLAQYK